MSKSNLLADKYHTTKSKPGKKLASGEKIKPSISNSFIKKQTAQMKTVSQGKGYQYTMGQPHSKKVSEIRSKMESSVALPKIGK